MMHLLAELYTHKEMAKSVDRVDERPLFDLNEMVQSDEHEDDTKQVDDPCLLSTLAPRLWPFMRHNIMSVRCAAISTMVSLKLNELLNLETDDIKSN